jgi:outer membrane PBP1 activator LpoA protein
VIGPLLRRNVTQIADELLLPVPVLSLNYLADDIEAPPGFFQFALAPEDEAASAAQRAVGDQGQRAVALVPGNDWGRRVLASFATEFEGLGGTLVDYKNYDPVNQDFSFEIEGLMALTESIERYQRLRANINQQLQFDPRRREDIDLIFLAADGNAGRLIKSQLKFHYSGDIPVYSTSFIHSMDGRSNSDLNDLMFADAPWVVAPPAWIADYPALYAEYWPAERRLARLHAMGYDAYHLVGELFIARETGMEEIVGATGKLFLTSDGRVHRRLAWARFERGEPVPLPEINEFGDALDDVGSPDEGNGSVAWPDPSGER